MHSIAAEAIIPKPVKRRPARLPDALPRIAEYGRPANADLAAIAPALPRGRDTDLLTLLKARLQIFLYRHPVDEIFAVIDVIENAESIGEIQLLLDYVLARRTGLQAT